MTFILPAPQSPRACPRQSACPAIKRAETLQKRRSRPSLTYRISLSQLGYLILLDAVEIACLCGQPRGWILPALPALLAGDTAGVLMLVCSRDWYGLWYWHGPYYSLSQDIGMGLFIALP